ncbi:MAG: extracellular solute-binding protein [Bacilli bacterium]|nr:extracellular solute-binding protein [Bacilli bacterium]
MNKKSLLIAMPFLALGIAATSGCAKKYDVKIVIYNWEDYIYTGADEDGTKIDDEGGIVERFQTYISEKTGKKVKVDYQTFSTNEIMYQEISLGSIKPDLICPSDYMIQKMANEGLLEAFPYDEATDTYEESLSNWSEYGSPYLKSRFSNSKLNNGSSFLKYAVPYFWGTMGWTYDPDYFDEEEVNTWECLWNKDSKFNKQFSLKDSMRDTYVAGIYHVKKAEIAALDETDPEYNDKLTKIFNSCDDTTIAQVEAALIEAKKSTVYGFEVDEGKEDIVKGKYHANLAWSGDSVFSMDSAEEGEPAKYLNYALPEEGSNIWFDGWCMPKGAQVEYALEFVNFISNPDNAALCMDHVGYTSPIAGEAIWELVNDWYAAEEDAEADEVDLSYFFGNTLEEPAIINVPTEERGRQFDAQYPTEDAIKKCCIMQDFGTQTAKVEEMWKRVKVA